MARADGDKVHARYSLVERRVWNDMRGLAPIPPCGFGLRLYLMTTPYLGVLPGLLVAGEYMLAEHLGWSIEAFREAFAELSVRGLAKADWKSRLVFMPEVAAKAIERGYPESPNVISGWRSQWLEVPDCAIKLEYFRVLQNLVKGLGEGFGKAFEKAIEDPSRNQNQDQNQIQEQIPEENPISSGSVDPGSISTTTASSSIATNPEPSSSAEPASTAPETTTESSTPQAREPSPADTVFERYLAGWRLAISGKRPPVFSEQRKHLVRRRLKDGLHIDDLLEAAGGVWRSAWHVNNGRHDFDLVFRDVKHVEMFRDMPIGGYGGPAPVGAHSDAKAPQVQRALDLWRETYAKSRRNYGIYVDATRDNYVVTRLVEHAQRHAEAQLRDNPTSAGGVEPLTERVLTHWFRAYLRDDGDRLNSLIDRKHSIAHIERRLTEYGLPWGAPRGPQRQPDPIPTPEEIAGAESARREALGKPQAFGNGTVGTDVPRRNTRTS